MERQPILRTRARLRRTAAVLLVGASLGLAPTSVQAVDPARRSAKHDDGPVRPAGRRRCPITSLLTVGDGAA